jgi:uncharacterized protein (TIGR00369 family)
MTNFTDNNLCFVCGSNNPHGLRLQFHHDTEINGIRSEVTFPEYCQGWTGVVHGGLVSTVLDEIMVKSTSAQGYICVTAEIFVKFKKPVLTGSPYVVTGKITDIKRKLIFTEGKIMDVDKQIVALASAKFFTVGRK